MSIFKRNMKKVQIQGKTTFDEDVFCDVASVLMLSERLERKVVTIYGGLRTLNQRAMESNFSPKEWAKNINKLCDDWQDLLKDKTFKGLNFDKQQRKLAYIAKENSENIIEPNTNDSIFSSYYRYLLSIKEMAEYITPELLKSVENGYNYNDLYVNLSIKQRMTLAEETKKIKLNLKKLQDLYNLARDAFEIESFESLIEPVIRIDHLLNHIKEDYDNINKNCGNVLRFLSNNEMQGKDFISFCIDKNYNNAFMLEVIVNYDVKIPNIENLGKKLDYDGTMAVRSL